ncbi:hypothetical protein M8C21_025637 [Ambrosia artemisiifolia]|uniref:Uncharacterized protein n=1 Tax=Ambrosia artemisiifolia TaxID=4212 RepID=A0AAD5G759_AMBAR|nr:hypothetical protein M8C21_025637 [Ambrosia artemisiifolia]
MLGRGCDQNRCGMTPNSPVATDQEIDDLVKGVDPDST